MKPRILVFTTAYYPFIGGAEIAIQEIAERLKDRFDFYIITSRFNRDLPRREIRPEGTVIRLGFGTSFDKWLLLFCAFYYRGLYYRGRTSIVMGVDISTGSLAAAILKLFYPGVPFILNIQYGDSEERLAKGRLGTIGMAFRFMLSRADHVTTLSSYLLGLARQYGYKGSAEVIPNGVDLQKFTKHKIQSTNKAQNTKFQTIITTSRLVPKNGVDILIQAIAEVKKKMPDIQCWILGDGPDFRSLKLQVTSLKLTENVKFFGGVSYDKIPEYLHQADVFVRSSRSEGMGSSFVQALAAGLPIIGTKVGGITDIIEDGKTGLFAHVGDPKDLAEKIMSLLGDQNLTTLIVREGQKIVKERFSLDSVAGKYSQIFDNYYRGRTSIVRPLRILIATPLFPPQIGGPALYAKNLGKEFEKLGYDVRMVSFTSFLRYPSGIRHLFYFLLLLCRGRKSEMIFALDYTSVGLPAAVASLLLRRPLVIRVEGDFLWESFVQRSRKDITLSQFYQISQSLTIKERLVRKVSGWAMRRARLLVFSSQWRRSMVLGAYSIAKKKTAIIRNVWPRAVTPYPKPHTLNPHIILWAGRMLYLKNLYRLIISFARANDDSWELHLVGDGPEKKGLKSQVKSLKLDSTVRFFDPLSQEKLLEKMARSAFFILPSLSEVGPNVIADALFAQTPFLMSKESGYNEYISDCEFLIDPLSEEDIESKMKILMDDNTRRICKKKLENAALNRSWAEAAGEWVYLFQPFLSARTR